MSNFEEDYQEVSTHKKNPNPLERESILKVATDRQKNFRLLGIVGMGIVAILLLIVFGGNEKENNGLEKDAIEFEPASQNPLVIPTVSPPPSLPEIIPPLDNKEDLEAQETLRQARLKSAIVVFGDGKTTTSEGLKKSEDQPMVSSNRDPNAQFQQDVGNNVATQVKAIQGEGLEQKILQGKFLDAVLETAIHSDLPGLVRAMINHDIYAEAGNQVLIPKGSRLIGEYNSGVANGQSRVFVVWNRVIRPDGIEVALNSGGTDTLGKAGLSGKVNRHFWSIFGHSLLLSVIGAGTANAGVDSTDQYNSMAAYRAEASEAFQNSAAQVLQSSLDIPPTIMVKQGALVKVLVAQDLDFSQALTMSQQNNLVFAL